MRIRHRQPSIFSLSMVDVFCCALGCVLLLWLWNARQMQDYQKKNEEAIQQAKAVRAENEQFAVDLAYAHQIILEMEDTAAGATRARAELDKELEKHRLRIIALETQINDGAKREALTSKDLEGLRALLDRERLRAAAVEKEKTTLADRLRALQALADRLPDLEKSLALARENEKKTASLLAARDADLAASMTKEKAAADALLAKNADLADLARRVQALTADKAALDKMIAARNAEAKTTQATLTSTNTTLTAATSRVRELEKELAASIRNLLDLQDEMKKMQAKADARFAGVALTGRRVVFLVDVSGSMASTADDKPDLGKWFGVVDTIVKVMQSLPDLEFYQVVTFSKEGSFPLGQPGQWLRFDPKAAPDLVRRTLLDPKNKPDGGTNMYAGLEHAFKMRPGHLDTIYLFSDGLPSRGAGVDLATARTLTDSELARRLGDHVRKTLREDWNKVQPNVPKVRIHSIGFFYDSPDVGAFLWALSRENEGSFVGMSKP